MLYLSVFLAALALQTNAGPWNYEEPDKNTGHWARDYPECGFSRQSPIDLPLQDTSLCSKPLELDWISQKTQFAIMNSGYSLKAVPLEIDHKGGADISNLEILHHTNDTNIRLKNKFFHTYESNINREYCFDSLHFHWGRHNGEGSEHTFNGKAYPLEVHLVHYSCDYDMAGPAIGDYISGKANADSDDPNVLAVIGVMFEIGDANPILAKILDDVIIDGIFAHEPESQFPQLLQMYYTEFDLKWLLPESREMVAYLGSLTTPPCLETVRWHVMTQPLTVSEEQMELLRTLLEGTDVNSTIAPNYRPVMPINDRTIYQCEEHIDNDKVEKAKESEEEPETVTEVVQQFFSGESTKKQWKTIATVFIVLFGVVTIICLCVMCYLCRSFRQMKNARKNTFELEDRRKDDEEDKLETNATN